MPKRRDSSFLKLFNNEKIHSSPIKNSHYVRLECSIQLLGFSTTWIIFLILEIFFCSSMRQHGSRYWDANMYWMHSTPKCQRISFIIWGHLAKIILKMYSIHILINRIQLSFQFPNLWSYLSQTHTRTHTP